MSNVIELGNITRLDAPTDRVLDDGGTVLWLLEQTKLALLSVEVE